MIATRLLPSQSVLPSILRKRGKNILAKTASSLWSTMPESKSIAKASIVRRRAAENRRDPPQGYCQAAPADSSAGVLAVSLLRLAETAEKHVLEDVVISFQANSGNRSNAPRVWSSFDLAGPPLCRGRKSLASRSARLREQESRR